MSPDATSGSMDLFDGETLAGWRHAGAGGFEVVEGALEARGGMGLLWYPARQLADFVLELEWRTTRPTDNGGVFVRFPDPGDDPWVAVHEGYEVQILDEADEPERRTGSIYTFAAPTMAASRPPGTWNSFVISVRQQDYEVELNGHLVTRHHGDRRLRGHVGVQNHDERSRVQYRALRVTEL